MATKKVGGGRGRIRLALFLTAFLVISGGVILRRSYGNRSSREITVLESQRAAIIAQRLRLEGEIRAASSRGRLQPIAEQQLHMKVPPDSLVILVPRAAP
jgi:cell division protein FtsL